MATYASLTDEQKAKIQSLASFVRAEAIALAKLGNHGRAVASTYVGNLESVLALLDGSEPIPNTTNLAGAQSLTRDELVNLIGYLMTVSETGDGASGSYNTNYHRGLYAKACGTANLIG